MPQFIVEESPQALNVVLYGAGMIGIAVPKEDPPLAHRLRNRYNAQLTALSDPTSSLRKSMVFDPELREKYAAWMAVAGIE